MSTLKETGLSSNAMGNRKGKEELDDETRAGLGRMQQNDAEIDNGVGLIANSLDNLGKIAEQMNEEVCSKSCTCLLLADGKEVLAFI